MRSLIIAWGLGGIAGILLGAVLRMLPWATAVWDHELTVLQWAFVIVWIPVMAYSEGYKGFQLRFSPTAVARAWALADAPRPLHVLLGPLFCMGFFHASRRRLITTWGLTAAITLLVLGVKLLPQPWRGLVDVGVLAGLSWGALSIGWLALQAARGGGAAGDPQLP